MRDILQNQDPMKNIGTYSKVAVITGFILAMPLAILLLIQIYSVEPLSGFYKTLTTQADGHSINTLGRIVEIGAVLLLPTAFVISFIPIVRNLRTGKPITANPINLLLAVALFIFIAGIVVANVVDQYPCWIGVPNCD